MKPNLLLSLCLSVLPITLMMAPAAFSAPSAKSVNCSEVPSQVVFESSQKLFTVLTWLNWVGDADASRDLSDYDPLQAELLQAIQQSPRLKSLYSKHRAAYEAFFPQASNPYVKNGVLLIDAQYYGPAPDFRLPGTEALTALPADEKERIKTLPPAALLIEFDQALKLSQGWNTRYKAIHEQYLQKYTQAAKAGILRAQCFLKMKPQAPVQVVINPMDSLGTTGQTSYDKIQKRFLIKLHIHQKYADPLFIERMAAHEYSHALMNEALASYQETFAQKLQAVAHQTGVETLAQMPVQELFARAMEYAGQDAVDPSILDSATYYGQNPILPYLLRQEADYRRSGLSFEAFLPQFLEHFDPAQEALEWQKMRERQLLGVYANEENTQLLAPYGLKPASLVSAIAHHADLLKPKLAAWQQQVKLPDPETLEDLNQLVFQCFESKAYFDQEPEIRENLHYIYKNPLFYLFTEKLQAAQHPQAGKLDPEVFIRDLFAAFDTQQEVARWQRIEARFADEADTPPK